METTALTLTLVTLATHWLNGVLASLYWLGDHGAVFAALGVALLLAELVEGGQGRQAGTRDRRYGRGPVNQASWQRYVIPVGVALFYTGAVGLTPAPVPQIGLAMWLAALLLVAALPLNRRHVGHTARWLIGSYAAVLYLFWLIVRFPLSPTAAAAWSERLQTIGAGESLDWAIRAQLIPYVTLLIWGILPISYFGFIAQQFATQRHLLVDPFKTVAQRLADWRARGED